MALGDLLKEFLDYQVIQESQVNADPLVQWDLQEGRDLVLLGRKETRVILAVQDSKVRKDCSHAALLRQLQRLIGIILCRY